jgi:hypothetical protein
MSEAAIGYSVEPLDESSGHCDCCGNASRSIWGLVHRGDRTVAAYWLHWTVGHLNEPGANLDMIIGAWGEDATAQDRVATSLLYREPEHSPPAFMVIDAGDRPIADSELIRTALRRDEVIGTPMAEQIFALVDAVWEQDRRFVQH